MVNKEEHKVGIYVRLSNEDERKGESVSIENQKLMLTKHVKEMGWDLKETYIDDGFTGTNQNRPAFQRMIADVKRGFINKILIKDLSRLGRNYLEVGNLAEVFLPEYGCELISLSEKIDDMMVFRNWFNEQHSKTTSKKVRASRQISAEDGKFMGTYAPYGFKKDPENRHHLVIDEKTAPIVRRIFELRAAGGGYRAIAIKLNEEQILAPKEYYYQSIGGVNHTRGNHVWNDSTIKVILENEAYVGNLVQCKSGTISYKNRKQVSKPEEEWIRVEHTHEPIITQDLWERVKALGEKRYKPRKNSDGGYSLFSGLLVCEGCGFKLVSQTERKLRKSGNEYVYKSYMCGTYSRSGKGVCTAHTISEKALSELVIEHIRKHAKMARHNEQRIIEALLSRSKDQTVSYRASYESEIESHRKRIEKLDTIIGSLCEDRASGIVPEDMFKRYTQKYEQERINRLQSVETLESRIRAIKENKAGAENWTQLIKQYTQLETLDSDILLRLIDKIVVSEARYVDGNRICDVQIFYNYVGNIDGLTLDEGVYEYERQAV